MLFFRLQPAAAADQRGRQRWEARTARSMATPNIRRLQAMTLAKLRRGGDASSGGGGATPPLKLTPEQQELLGQVFPPLVFDAAGRAVSGSQGTVEQAAPSAALDEKQAAIFVDAYELPDT